MQQVLMVGKVLAALTWLWGAAGMLGAPVPFAEFSHMVVIALAMAHAMEVPLFLPRLLKGGGDAPRHIMALMAFGVLHYYSERPEELGGKRA